MESPHHHPERLSWISHAAPVGVTAYVRYPRTLPMELKSEGAVTAILRRFQEDGDADGEVLDHLVPAVYGELKRLARSRLGRGGRRPGHLDTTSLVHEVYLKLQGGSGDFQNRPHFFAVVARAMRQVVIDEARRVMADKRGGGERPVTLDEGLLAAGAALPVEAGAPQLLALDAALDRLEELSPRLAGVVELRFFAGLTEEETAEQLGLSARTVRRDWTKARAWLHRELRQDGA